MVVLRRHRYILAMVAENEASCLVREGTFIHGHRCAPEMLIMRQYNYLMSAALDGGSQVILFILSFAVFGASGTAVDFPTWWGNPSNRSVDRCKLTPQ
jgi:hypothetical protein